MPQDPSELVHEMARLGQTLPQRTSSRLRTQSASTIISEAVTSQKKDSTTSKKKNSKKPKSSGPVARKKKGSKTSKKKDIRERNDSGSVASEKSEEHKEPTKTEEDDFVEMSCCGVTISKEQWARYKEYSKKANERIEKTEPLSADGTEIPRWPETICLGRHRMETWFTAPFPSEFSHTKELFFCEHCLQYMKTLPQLIRHAKKCEHWHPPGNEIYRKGDVSVFEVDGAVAGTYCQNLYLLAKLFLDSKSLFYDVEHFLCYVVTKNDEKGCHLVGYFSKERYGPSTYNLSCIVTLPAYHKQGYGRFLIDFSYLLTRREKTCGSPERPLSDLGRVSYAAYWKSALLEYLRKKIKIEKKTEFIVSDIAMDTGIALKDAVEVLMALGMMKKAKKKNWELLYKEDLVEAHWKKAMANKERIWIDEKALEWSPPPLYASKDFNAHLRSPPGSPQHSVAASSDAPAPAAATSIKEEETDAADDDYSLVRATSDGDDEETMPNLTTISDGIEQARGSDGASEAGSMASMMYSQQPSSVHSTNSGHHDMSGGGAGPGSVPAGYGLQMHQGDHSTPPSEASKELGTSYQMPLTSPMPIAQPQLLEPASDPHHEAAAAASSSDGPTFTQMLPMRPHPSTSDYSASYPNQMVNGYAQWPTEGAPAQFQSIAYPYDMMQVSGGEHGMQSPASSSGFYLYPHYHDAAAVAAYPTDMLSDHGMTSSAFSSTSFASSSSSSAPAHYMPNRADAPMHQQQPATTQWRRNQPHAPMFPDAADFVLNGPND